MHAQDRGGKPQETNVAGARRESGGQDAAPRVAGQPGPGLLANRSAVQALQRLVGNRAVSRLIARIAEGEPTGSEPPHETSADGLHETAAEGVATPPGDLPHRDRIQESFGRHSIEGVRAHVGDGATASALAMGAKAYTSGEHVVFAGTPTLETAAHEAAHVVQQRQGVDLPGGVGQPGDAYERHADAVAGEVASGGSAEALLGAPGPSAARADATGSPAPVQRKEYSTPQDADIAQIMKDAGITAFGPYVFVRDDTPNSKTPPLWKLNSAAAKYTYTIDDCLNKVLHDPEKKAVEGEKLKNPLPKLNLIADRRKAALAKLYGGSQVGLKIFDMDNGDSPRPFSSIAEEDKEGGHIRERHILGMGIMTDASKVALRAAFWKVDGSKLALQEGGDGTASVWTDAATAKTAIEAALAAKFSVAKEWLVHRETLAKGTTLHLEADVPSACVAYTKRDPPPADPYKEDDEFPKYIDPSKKGERELYPGHYKGAGRPTDPDGPDPTRQALTSPGATSLPHVYLVIEASAKAPGGWFIKSAYPKP